MSVSFDSYKIFYHTAQYQNITLAARALFLTQPTVSHAIAGLESELGCRLFLRSKKGVQLTPEGKLLYTHIEKAYQNILDGERSLRNHLSLSEGFVRIGASETTLHHYLLPYLEQFRARYPHIRLKISTTNTPAAIASLKQGEIDFAAVISPITDTSLSIMEAADLKDIFIAGPQFSHMKGQGFHISDLTDVPLICLEKGTTTREHLETIFNQNHTQLIPDIELATSDLITPMVAHNLGIGFVPYHFAQDALQKGDVFQLDILDPIPKRSICIVTNPETPLPVAAEKMTELLHCHFH